MKPIEEIEVGDKVLAYDEETGKLVYKPVVRLFRNETKEWYHVFVEGEKIVCTGGHPFYVLGIGFVEARNLKTSDKLLLSNGKEAIIEKVEVRILAEAETTYNFEVADFHTYYVSEKAVLVHNDCDPLGIGTNKGANRTATYKEYSLKDRGIKVEVRPGEGLGRVSHNTPHAHVIGKGFDTTVGLSGLPVNSSHAALTGIAKTVVEDNWDYIVKIIGKVWP